MADKIVVMQGGRIEQAGAPLELYDRPANTFVASFIGSPSMNMLSGMFSEGGFAFSGITLPLPPGVSGTPGAAAIYGIRPEALRPAESGIPATVAVVEPTGSETHVVMRTEAGEVVSVFRERISYRPGDRLTLAPDPAAAHIFDKATGKRI